MSRPRQLEPDVKAGMLEHIRRHHPAINRHWFDEIEPVEMRDGTLRLLVREQVQLKFLRRCCMDQFQEAAQAVTGRLLAIRFVGEDEDAAEGAGETSGRAASMLDPKPEGGVRPLGGTSTGQRVHLGSEAPDFADEMILSPDHSFENFIVGPDNRLAHAAAVAVAEKPGRAYNPLFIHSGVGLGKTHLLQAICQTVLRRDPGAQIYYTSCDGFMTQFLEAVQAGQMADFRHRFRHVDILVIDDIHDLSKRERTQEEFFHTFNALYQAGRQIVLSSDAAPLEIPDLEERLISRFNCGLVARIDRPCFETRVEIVRSKSRLRGLSLPDDVVTFVAARIERNIREIEGAITKIQSTALVEGVDIDLELARNALGDAPVVATSRQPTIQQIIDAVTGFYDVKLTDLLSRKRQKSIAFPRQVGMWLARRHTRYSLEEIGGYFGGRDHTTVMHAIKAIESKRDDDSHVAEETDRLEGSLGFAPPPEAD